MFLFPKLVLGGRTRQLEGSSHISHAQRGAVEEIAEDHVVSPRDPVQEHALSRGSGTAISSGATGSHFALTLPREANLPPVGESPVARPRASSSLRLASPPREPASPRACVGTPKPNLARPTVGLASPRAPRESAPGGLTRPRKWLERGPRGLSVPPMVVPWSDLAPPKQPSEERSPAWCRGTVPLERNCAMSTTEISKTVDASSPLPGT